MQRVLTSSKHKEKSVKRVCNGGESKCGASLKMPHQQKHGVPVAMRLCAVALTLLCSSPRGENMFPRACYCCALLMARLN